MAERRLRRATLVAALFLLPSAAAAQSAEPMPAGAPSGYELLLSGATRAERGHRLTLSGVAYEVEGLADLRPRAGLEVAVTITVRRGSGQTRAVASRASARSEAAGRFEVSIDVPAEELSAPQLEIDVGRPGGPARHLTFPLSPQVDAALDLLTDRDRYQPGETVHAWVRARGQRARRPQPDQALIVKLLDAQGQELATTRPSTGPSGAVSVELALPASAPAGQYVVRAERADGQVTVTRPIEIWRRTVERVMAEIELTGRDEDGVAIVRPGGPLRGRVVVTTPSGTPIRGAEVQLRVREGAEPTTLRTDGDGAATFDVRAPTFLSGDVAPEMILARATHPAHGTITASTRYLLARVTAVIEVIARGGALVPEVPGDVFLSVLDPRGRPLPAGTEVAVRGEGVQAIARLDDHGFADVSVTLPRGAAARMQQGPCAGRIAATLEVEVRTTPERIARVCVPVAADAQVAPVVLGAPVAAPGTALDVEIRRRPDARGQSVLLEARSGGRAVAFAWADGRADRASITLPDDLLGVIEIRARAVDPERRSQPASEPGAVAMSRGAADAVLVRPADAFALDVSTAQPRYLVRENATVRLGRGSATGAAWAALLVRDEAAHGGEQDWALDWLSDDLHEAARQPADQIAARLVRAALAAGLSIEPEPPLPAPLEQRYWDPRHYRPYHAGAQTGRGVLRDPVALREELLRRGLGPIEHQLEQIVRQLGTDAAQRARIVQARGSRVGFHPDVIERLVEDRRLARAQTLGGEPLTVAMIERADPGFSFDTVARRVARERLSRLLLGLLHLTDPENQNAQRASANLPPERWLGTLVQLGMVQASDLSDPWGRPFVFRRVGRPQIAVSERALEWELASPGPDGRAGTADDVNDPFARAVPEGTPYAVTSGEEQFVQRVGTLAPASQVLSRMVNAYDRLALAAQEEQREGPITASRSEMSDEAMPMEEAEMENDGDGILDSEDAAGFGGLGLRGTGRGGGGSGEGTIGLGSMGTIGHGAGAFAQNAPAPAPPPAPPAQMQGRARRDGVSDNRVAEALGATIREDFPATLFFRGVIPLDGADTTVEVPLADALTTYRVEAIAWSATGWTTSGDTRVRVDQRAVVDAPVPPFATVGDVLRLPVRVENRTDEPMDVRVQVEGEGELGFATNPATATIPAREARDVMAEITLEDAGDGAMVVALALGDGTPLDAVRRPFRVLADARTARTRRQRLVDGATTFELDVPAEASERGPGQLQITVGAALFGDASEIGHPLWAGWALRMSGEPLPDSIAQQALEFVTYEDDDRDRLRPPLESALALSATWDDDRLTDADAQRALRSVSQGLPAEDAPIEPAAIGEQPAELLLALAPVARQLSRRPGVRADVTATLDRLVQLTSSHAAQATDAPTVWAHAAAALASTGRARPRAEEMARRATRHVIAVGDMAWVEPEQPSGIEPRARPTALLALARIALGERPAALSLVRALIEMQRAASASPVELVRARIAGDILPPRPPFHGRERALAAAAAGRLAPSSTGPDSVVVRLDGVRLETSKEGAVHVAVLENVGRAGRHTIEVRLGEGEIALANLAVSYGMPWSVPPRRAAPIDLTLDGELGARDTRAGLRLYVRNRGARILTAPVVELELPAGAELDEPTREQLAAHLAGDAQQEGRTLVLPLRPLAPGAWIRLPLPARWAVGGTLRGLGAVAYDARGPDDADVLPTAVLASREVTLADDGPQPEPPDAEESETPPFPIPPPIPLLERLTPGGAR